MIVTVPDMWSCAISPHSASAFKLCELNTNKLFLKLIHLHNVRSVISKHFTLSFGNDFNIPQHYEIQWNKVKAVFVYRDSQRRENDLFLNSDVSIGQVHRRDRDKRSASFVHSVCLTRTELQQHSLPAESSQA